MSRASSLLLAVAGALTLAACAGPLIDTREIDRSLGLGGGGAAADRPPGSICPPGRR